MRSLLLLAVSFFPPAVNFPVTLLDTSAPSQVVTVDAPATIRQIAIVGAYTGDFNATPLPNNQIQVDFHPLPPWKKGTRNALLQVLTDRGAAVIPLTGTGATCAGAVPFSTAGHECPDSDGDGFNDVWEDNDYIDVDNDGVLSAGDYRFPHRAAHRFSPVSHQGSASGQVFPTVINPTQPISSSTIAVTIATGGAVGEASFTYSIDGGPTRGPLPVRPVVNLEQNLRLMFYNIFTAGDAYTFTTWMDPERKIADKNTPNIYVQYDSMGFDAPGTPCSGDNGCAINEVCRSGFCNHDHAPGDPLFRKIVDQYAAHGIILDIDPVHGVVPHAQVITFNQAGDGTTGATAACAGYNVIAGNISTGGAVNFHDIKNRNGLSFARSNIVHYSVLSHFVSCLQDAEGDGNCGKCPDDRATPAGKPTSAITGAAELPGNDFIVAVARRWYTAGIPRTPFDEQGTFMHELGHNLGLHHGGDKSDPDSAPNYLSVMNNKYITSGIQHAGFAGSSTSVESLREVNYSEHELSTLDEQHLDEQAGVSPLAVGYTGIVRFFTFAGGNGNGPESGPVNWDGFPATSCLTNSDCALGPASLTGVCLASGFCEVRADLNKNDVGNEIMTGYADWIHGPCTADCDCPINHIRFTINSTYDPSLDPHEPCVRSRCQSLWLPFQTTLWGKD